MIPLVVGQLLYRVGTGQLVNLAWFPDAPKRNDLQVGERLSAPLQI